MVEITIGAIIIAYTSYVVYRKTKDLKAGKSCCGGCSSCPTKGKCEKEL